jgi:hypothetical protein
LQLVRPQRDDIAAPDLPRDVPWVGDAPASMPNITAKGPVLVHFFDYSQVNSVRTLPYLIEWDRRYRDAGLSTIGVQSPRFPFAADPANVAAGLSDLGVGFPVAVDVERKLWHAYGCEGWPSLFLWSTGGALGWFQFGEGEYEATEEAIQGELRELDALRTLPAPMAPLRATDEPGARVIPPTPEVFPGGSWERPWIAGADGEDLALDYQAGEAYATIEGAGEVQVEIDGEWRTIPAGPAPGLRTLAEHPRHEAHNLVLRPAPSVKIWSIGFAPGIP